MHMIKKARARVGRLYNLHAYEEDNARLERVEELLESHTYIVRQSDRTKKPEVRYSQCAGVITKLLMVELNDT